MNIAALLLLFLSACTFKIYTTPDDPVYTSAVTPSVVHSSPATAMTPEQKEAFLENRWCPAKSMDVQVSNPNTVVIKDQKAKAIKRLTEDTQTLKFGDSCSIESTGLWESYGMVSEGGVDRVLVMYWADGPRVKYESCPNLVLFFIDFEDFWKHCTASSVTPEEITAAGKKKRAAGLHELWERQEKDKVKIILQEKKEAE